MSYTPTVWASGDVLTAQKLNKIESCLASLIGFQAVEWKDGDMITAGALNRIEDGIASCFNYQKSVWLQEEVISASKLNKIEEALEWAAKPFSDLTWEEVFTALEDGKYKLFQIGDAKNLDLGTEGIVPVSIAAIDTDILSVDHTSKAKLTLICDKIPLTVGAMNPALANPVAEGTGGIGGWPSCQAREYLGTIIKPLISSNLRAAIKAVDKYSRIYNENEEIVNNVLTSDELWLPSVKELFGGTQYETAGVEYLSRYPDNNSRKIKTQTDSATSYWLRSVYNTGAFGIVTGLGGLSGVVSSRELGLAFGFCL